MTCAGCWPTVDGRPGRRRSPRSSTPDPAWAIAVRSRSNGWSTRLAASVSQPAASRSVLGWPAAWSLSASTAPCCRSSTPGRCFARPHSRRPPRRPGPAAGGRTATGRPPSVLPRRHGRQAAHPPRHPTRGETVTVEVDDRTFRVLHGQDSLLVVDRISCKESRQVQSPQTPETQEDRLGEMSPINRDTHVTHQPESDTPYAGGVWFHLMLDDSVPPDA
jgi:hypothetical protein